MDRDKRLQQDTNMRRVYDLRVLVVGGGFQYLKMFYDAGLKGAKDVGDADIICFTGGEDVDPSYYSEEKVPGTHSNTSRDAREAMIYSEALVRNKPMVGICRGAQFLNVMNGGKLWQDVNNHAGRSHSVVDFRTGELVHDMTSTHHQQMREGPDCDIVAAAELSTKKVAATEIIDRDEPQVDDLEVLWYPKSLSLCFQPHPEFQDGNCRDYFLQLFDDYIMPAC